MRPAQEFPELREFQKYSTVYNILIHLTSILQAEGYPLRI